jgi:chromosome segregation ATPase
MSGDENRNINNINIYTGEDSKVNNDCSGCSYLNHQFDSLKEAALTNFNTLNTKIEKLREANSQQGTKLDELKTDNAELKNDNAKIQSEIDELKTDNAELKNDNAELKNDNAELKNDNAKIQSEIDELKNDNAELKNDNAKIQSEIDELKTDNAEMKTNNAELKTETVELRKDMNDLLYQFNYDRNCLALRSLLSKYDKDSKKESKFDASLITYFNSPAKKGKGSILLSIIRRGNYTARPNALERIETAVEATKDNILKEYLQILVTAYYTENDDEEEEEEEEE